MVRTKSVAVVVPVMSMLFVAGFSERQEPEYQRSKVTQIVLLGTGTPGPVPERSGPSTAIVVNGTPYLVDLGPGVVRRAMAAVNKGIKGLHYSNLKTAFITHLHSDHTVGYPDFVFTPWVVGREGPVNAYGPKGLDAMTRSVLDAWQEDIRIRNEGLERHFPEHNTTGYQVSSHEIEPGVVYRDANVTVTAFRVNHGEWPQAFGYRFQTPDRVVVISGDASPSQGTIDACNGCDVLIHEVYTQKAQEASPPAWQQYRLKYHTSSKQLADLATNAKPRLLILYHQIYYLSASTEEDLIREMRDAYKGKFVSGHDLDVF